jgi:hypothetical protein
MTIHPVKFLQDKFGINLNIPLQTESKVTYG